MRIVLLTSKLNFKSAGGSVMDLHLKAKGLVELGHDVTVVTAFSHVNVIEEKLPYRVIEERVSARGLLAIQFHAFRILQKYTEQADVFYIDGQIFIYGGGLYRVLYGRVPVVAFFNSRMNVFSDMSGNVVRPPLIKQVKKAMRYWIEYFLGTPIVNRVDAIIYNTPHVRKLYEAFGFNAQKGSVIEDFADMRGITERHHVTSESIRTHQKTDIVTFVTAGRMIPEKGFDIVVRAFALLPDKEKYRLVMAGGGSDRERIQNLVTELRLEKYIHLTGWVEKDVLEKTLHGAHVFIFPKWWIEYGSALLTEVFAYGLPSIIPGGGALEWLAKDGAITFAHEDPEDLTRQMQALAADSPARIRVATAALMREDALDYRVLTRKLAGVFDKVKIYH